MAKAEARRNGVEIQTQAAEARMKLVVGREAQANLRMQDFEQQHSEVAIQLALQQAGVQHLQAQRDMLSAEVQKLHTEVRQLAQDLRDLRLVLLAHNAEYGEKGSAALKRLKWLKLDHLDGPFEPDEGWVHQARTEIMTLRAEMEDIRHEQFDRWLRVGAAEAKTENQKRFILGALRSATTLIEKTLSDRLSNLGEGVDGRDFLEREKFEACLQRMREILASDPAEGRQADWPREYEMALWLGSHAKVEADREVARRRRAREAAEAAQRQADTQMRNAIHLGLQALVDKRLLMCSETEGFVVSEKLEPAEARALLQAIEPGLDWLRALSRNMSETCDAILTPHAQALKRNIALLGQQLTAVKGDAAALLQLRAWDAEQHLHLTEISERELPDFK